MEYVIYLFKFETAVHFGDGNLSGTQNTFYADSLFSALCNEAVKQGDYSIIEKLVKSIKDKKLRFSDMMPYIGKELYIPNPLCYAKDSYKQLKYIRLSSLNKKIDIKEEINCLRGLGSFDVRTMTSIRSIDKLETGEALPYSVGIFKFNDKSGLYFIAGFADEQIKKDFEALLISLKFSGIGGKRSSGLGRFRLNNKAVMPQILKERLKSDKPPFMALSTCMCSNDELEKSMKNANYILQKRSGFVLSENYSKENRRKKDFYAFSAGSCFENKFYGDVFDVSLNGNHPVYRYSASLFMGV